MKKYRIVTNIIAVPIIAYLVSILGISELRAQVKDQQLDVLHYQVSITPDIAASKFDGSETITLVTGENKISLDCRGLEVRTVEGEFVKEHLHKYNKLIVTFNPQSPRKKQIRVEYSGNQSSGIKFFPGKKQVHTTYFTQDWLICNNKPNDRATIYSNLILDEKLKSIATGSLSKIESSEEGKVIHSWKLEVAAPAYTYGFVAGELNHHIEDFKNSTLHHYSSSYTSEQMKEVFTTTSDILEFFETKAGMPYFQKSYSQFLGQGNVSQEVCGFALLRGEYGNQVLRDSTQINLSAHELAHQWWGNMITCESYRHFWLNEAMAVFMSSVYKEYRFGKEKYKEDIGVYLQVYNNVKKAGEDKPLVFESWDNPSRNDRNIVYYKGAYVLHLLREKVGDEKFWQGVKNYSQRYYGQSAITEDFQSEMEIATGTDLSGFFAEWVY
ncbi:MAG: M1 family aminopeptidase [Bacteroidota bacterium]